MNLLDQYNQRLKEVLTSFELPKEPANLYGSMEYIIGLGGKRLRPLMVFFGADTYGAVNDNSNTLALVVELFHNFSLMHDDIMDRAELRRGKPAVHIKWDVPTAILGGDGLLVKTYEVLLRLPVELREDAIKLYNRTALEVCEGQQFDMDFEKRESVSVDEYIEMVRLKTAVLMGAAFQFGALSAGADKRQQALIYDFGQTLGIAFQLKDDYLDCFGQSGFGKRIGGDIVENKKTYLQLMALDKGSSDQVASLKALWQETDETVKISAVQELFVATGAKEAIEEEMLGYYDKAKNLLDQLDTSEEMKANMGAFAEMIWNRNT